MTVVELDKADLSEAIHRATFGYPLTSRQATTLMRAYMQRSFELSASREEVRRLKVEVDGQREAVEALTAEGEAG